MDLKYIFQINSFRNVWLKKSLEMIENWNEIMSGKVNYNYMRK